MKKLYLAFIAVLALSMGCAITNYPVITDTEGDSAGFIVNTNGKAVIVPTSQVITLFPDMNVELFSMVDQKANGDQTIGTYSNISYGSPKFMDFVYCNPDWTGCWVTQADNPLVGDASIFDYTWNQNCDGAGALSLLVSFGARTQECGRLITDPAAQAQLLTDLVPDGNGYRLYLSRSVLRLSAIDEMGVSRSIPTYGSTALQIDERGRVAWTFSSSAKPSVLALSRAPHTQLQANYKGHNFTFDAQMRDAFVSYIVGL
jgi:hypothetical protein